MLLKKNPNLKWQGKENVYKTVFMDPVIFTVPINVLVLCNNLYILSLGLEKTHHSVATEM